MTQGRTRNCCADEGESNGSVFASAWTRARALLLMLHPGRTRHCNSLHNCPGSHRTICLDSFLLHILHSSRGQGHPALVPGSAAPAWALVLVPGSLAPAWAATGTNQSVQRKRSGRRPILRDSSASSTGVCSLHHRDNPRAARLDRSLACSADTPNPATAC